MSARKPVQPNMWRYMLHSLGDELLALMALVRSRWYLFVVAVIAAVVLIQAYEPLSPRALRMASGQANSTLDALAERYSEILARHGVRVEKVPSKGAIDSLGMLEAGKVDVALSQGGAAVGGEQRAVYLASVGYQALWFFYKGAPMRSGELWQFMLRNQVSIGPPGSGTRRLFDAITSRTPTKMPADLRTSEMGAAESVSALLDGRIQGMFLLAGPESGNARTLMSHPDVQMLSFPFAGALVAQHSYLEAITLHRGSLGLVPMHPAEDLQMVATTTTLLGTRNLHPALEQLLLRASVEIGNEEQVLFRRAGGFPALVDRSLPQSELAKRYLTAGPPALESRLPFWASSLLDRTWFWLLGVSGVAYSLLRILPRYRLVSFEVLACGVYGEIFSVYRAAEEASTPDDCTRVRASADALTRRMNRLWVPKGGAVAFLGLLMAQDLMIRQVEMLEARLLQS